MSVAPRLGARHQRLARHRSRWLGIDPSKPFCPRLLARIGPPLLLAAGAPLTPATATSRCTRPLPRRRPPPTACGSPSLASSSSPTLRLWRARWRSSLSLGDCCLSASSVSSMRITRTSESQLPPPPRGAVTPSGPHSAHLSTLHHPVRTPTLIFGVPHSWFQLRRHNDGVTRTAVWITCCVSPQKCPPHRRRNARRTASVGPGPSLLERNGCCARKFGSERGGCATGNGLGCAL